MASAPAYQLNNGQDIPSLGFGTWKLADGEECYQAVRMALDAGYRHIDTAKIYGNEESVGRAIGDSGIERSEIFVTTKLWESDYGHVTDALAKSLRLLGLDYIDLYLIHWPARGRLQAWKVMEGLASEGRAKAIGVSNFTIRHLRELLDSSEMVPALNQVEMHPFLYQRELIEFCNQRDIAVSAYSPLTRGAKFDHHTIQSVAKEYDKTPAQVMLRWSLQHGLIPLPKATSHEHIADNLGALDWELNEHDMLLLDNLNEGYRVTRDPEELP